jgi:ABC-type uncharacterized transport system permease subunit
MAAQTTRFVCPECNEIVLQPITGKGFLLCENGHRVQGLKQRPLWREVGLSLLIAFILGNFVIGAGNALSGNATAAALTAVLLLTAWPLFLIRKAVKYRRSGGVVADLARQYIAAAAGFMAVAVLIGCGVLLGSFRW